MKSFVTKFLIGGVLLFGLLSTRTPNAAADSAQPPTPSVIRIAPVAPIFDDQTRLAELLARRARVAEAVGPKGILILFSTEPRVYTNDVDYEYRQENNLYYLTGLKQNNATVVMLPGNTQTPEILFMPRRNPLAETWTGHMYSAQEASQLSGIKEIWDVSEFEPFMSALRNRQPYRPKPEHILLSSLAPAENAAMPAFEKLFAAVARNEGAIYLLVPGEGESREYKREQRFAADWAKTASGFSIKNITPVFAGMRLRKSPMEIAFMQHAIDITTEAHERAWVAAATAKWEYEVDALVAYTYKLRNADHWGYPSIVGCGPNATTLHYEEAQGPVTPGSLLLMDVGAEYEHYSADVTRTFPVNGRFSTEQAEVYQIVYDAQDAAANATVYNGPDPAHPAPTLRPDVRISDVHRAATEVIKNGLLKLGLITDRNSNQYRIWFMHGTSHWLGMNVHDVGDYATKLEPGMVFTNEPGIYVRPDAFDNKPANMSDGDWEKFKAAVRPAFEKYKGIGVRIEDDLLVTPEGVRWMTEALPRKIADIEAFIAKARAEARQSGN